LQYAVEQRPAGREGLGIQASVDARLGIKPAKWLGIADTLVMVFSGLDADFVALDAYTNAELWAHTNELALPEVNGVGRLRLAGPPLDTDRIDIGVVPQFQYSEQQVRLRISLGRRGTRHYQVSSCLVVGVDDRGIATLDLSSVEQV